MQISTSNARVTAYCSECSENRHNRCQSLILHPYALPSTRNILHLPESTIYWANTERSQQDNCDVNTGADSSPKRLAFRLNRASNALIVGNLDEQAKTAANIEASGDSDHRARRAVLPTVCSAKARDGRSCRATAASIGENPLSAKDNGVPAGPARTRRSSCDHGRPVPGHVLMCPGR